MDASVQDYVWNGNVELQVDTSCWSLKDWIAQYYVFFERFQSLANSWRGFRTIRDLIPVLIEGRHPGSRLIRNAYSYADKCGKEPVSPSTHVQSLEEILYCGMEDSCTQRHLLLSRRLNWLQLSFEYTGGVFGCPSEISLMSWSVEYLGYRELEDILATNHGLAQKILHKFHVIIATSVVGMEADLNVQRKSLREFAKVLSRMKF